jgi:hypothetical protein
MKRKNKKNKKNLANLFLFSYLLLGVFGINYFNRQSYHYEVQAEQIKESVIITEDKEEEDKEFYPVRFVESPENYVGASMRYIENPTKIQILAYLHFIGESENIDKWGKIIETESKWDVNSKAPTYWSICKHPVTYTLWGYRQHPTRFIELRDYDAGRVWQATCEELGSETIERGVTGGLVHILSIVWKEVGCNGKMQNWHDELNCAKKIKDTRGWSAWSYI